MPIHGLLGSLRLPAFVLSVPLSSPLSVSDSNHLAFPPVLLHPRPEPSDSGTGCYEHTLSTPQPTLSSILGDQQDKWPSKVFPKLLSQAEFKPANILEEHFRVPVSMQRPEGAA